MRLFGLFHEPTPPTQAMEACYDYTPRRFVNGELYVQAGCAFQSIDQQHFFLNHAPLCPLQVTWRAPRARTRARASCSRWASCTAWTSPRSSSSSVRCLLGVKGN